MFRIISISIIWLRRLDWEIKMIFLLFIILLPILFRIVLHKYDPVGYFSWVRSLVINGDLNVTDTFTHFDFGGRFLIKGKTGTPGQPWAVGCAILWLPAFLIAHLGVLIANALGESVAANGYSLPYIGAVSLATVLYGLGGLMIMYKLIKNYYGEQIAGLSVTAIWLASPLVFYMYSHPMMSHANDMFAYTLLLWAWQYARQSQKGWPPYVLLGAAAGLSALIRNQNAALVLLIVAFIMIDTIRKQWTWQQSLAAIAIFSLVWWIAFFPQLYVWHATIGVWFPGNPSSMVGGGDFYWGVPWIFDVMFSSNRGLFIWNPILLFAVMGWIFLFKKDPALTIFLVASFCIQLGVIGSWNHWHGDNAFGQRFFVNLTPAFMFGFAALVNELRGRVSPKTLGAMCSIFILWNFLLIVQYAMQTIPRGGPVSLSVLARNQFLIIPRNLSRIIEAWIRKS